MAENGMDNHYFDREHRTEKDSAIPHQSSRNMLPACPDSTIKYNIVLFKKRGALTP